MRKAAPPGIGGGSQIGTHVIWGSVEFDSDASSGSHATSSQSNLPSESGDSQEQGTPRRKQGLGYPRASGAKLKKTFEQCEAAQQKSGTKHEHIEIRSESSAHSSADDDRKSGSKRGDRPKEAASGSRNAPPPPPGVWNPQGDQNLYDPSLASVGALKHSTGNCKPCAWHWKPNGCTFGKGCFFCHQCAPGMVRERRKERVGQLKAERWAARAAAVQLLNDGAGLNEERTGSSGYQQEPSGARDVDSKVSL